MEASRWFSLSLLYLESRGRTPNQRKTGAGPRTEEVAHKVLNHEHVSPSDNSRACPTCLSKLLEESPSGCPRWRSPRFRPDFLVAAQAPMERKCLKQKRLVHHRRFQRPGTGPGGNSAQPRALRAQERLTHCKGNLKEISTELEKYSTYNAGTYPAQLSQLEPQMRKALPECPANGHTYGLRVTRDLKNCQVWCAGGKHSQAGLGRNFPQYSSLKGFCEL